MIVNVILAILVLSVIIIVHEFGHFIVAKANGVTVLEFALGFGPKLIHFKKGETVYSIKLLPFGGSCMMLGDEFMEAQTDEDEDEQADEKDGKAKTLEEEYDADRAFSNKSVWSRIAIIAAGPLFNFLLALILSIIMIGVDGYDLCTVDKVYDNSPAQEAGLAEGDTILKINGDKMSCSREYSFYRYYNAAKTMNITYERDGQKYTTQLTPQYTKLSSYKMGVVIEPDCTIQSVTKDSPAEAGGMQAKDIILSVDGIAMENSTQFTEYLNRSTGETLSVVVSRNGNQVTLAVTPQLVEQESYYTGLASYGEYVKLSPAQTIVCAFKEVGYWIEIVIESLGMMFTGQVGINDLTGPVGTVSVMSSVVESSKPAGTVAVLMTLFSLAIMISANLGVMNLLPLPALDGGRLVFFILEVLRGKPVKKEHEGMVHFVGMILLMLLMAYVMFKDIRGLF